MINALKLLGICILLYQTKSAGWQRLIMLMFAGIAIGLSSACKTITIVTFLVLALLLLNSPAEQKVSLRDRLVGLSSFALGAGSVWAFIFLINFANGSFHEFWDAVFIYNKAYSPPIWQSLAVYFSDISRIFPPFFKWEAPFMVLVFVFTGTLVLSINRFQKSILLLLLLAACIETAMPGKFFPHYYQIQVPFIVIAAAWVIYELAQAIFHKWAPYALAVFTAAVCLPLVLYNIQFFKTFPDDISINKYGDTFISAKLEGEYMKDNFRAGMTIYQWGDATGLYYYSKMDTDIPYFYFYPFLFGKSEDKARRAARFIEIIDKRPPDIFIDLTKSRAGESSLPAINKDHGIAAFLKKRYTFYEEDISFDVYCNNRLTVLKDGKEVCDIEKHTADVN
jgi:hypothetical protein